MADYEAASLKWICRIIAALPAGFPVILYAKGTACHHAAQAAAGVRVLSVDAAVDLPALAASRRRDGGPALALQGNLDPVLLDTTPVVVRREARRLLDAMRGSPGHIFDLGHGILPAAKLECVAALVDTVVTWR